MGTVVLIVLLASLSSLLAVLPPQFLGAAINAIVGAERNSQTYVFSPVPFFNEWLVGSVAPFDTEPVVVFLVLFFLTNLIFMLVRSVFCVYVSIVSGRFTVFVRQACFDRILRGRKADLDRFESGDLVHRVMNDTGVLGGFMGSPVYIVFSDLLDLLWISVIIIMIDWKILLILGSVIPVLYIISRKTAALQRGFAEARQQNAASCMGFIQRTVMGLDTVKACQGERRETANLSRLNDDNMTVCRHTHLNLGLFYPQEGVLRATGTIAVIAYAAYLATKDAVYIGIIPVLLIYTNKFYAPLRSWTDFYQSIQQGLVSYQRLQEILNLPEEKVVRMTPARLQQILPFKVDGHIMLESGNRVPLSFEVDRPGLVILKGKSGIGKTRLITSLVGLGLEFKGDLKPGNIILDGHQNMRNHVTLATQDAHIVPGTLAENLCYPEAHVDKSRCSRILEELCLDYDLNHPVTEYGRNLSLGEQRRVIFGRALYADKPVMILDEIDANVDKETRARLYQTIRRVMVDKVIIMTSHVHTSELEGPGITTVTVVQKAACRS